MTPLARLSMRPERKRPVLASLWVGEKLPPLEWACLTSWVQSGYPVRVYSYNSELELPAGVEPCKAEDVLPDKYVFANHGRKMTYAGFSNLFRYALLQQTEDYWIDADMLAGGAQLEEAEYVFGFETVDFVNSAILRAPANSAFLNSLSREAWRRSQTNWKWGDLGPRLVTKKIFEFGLELDVAERDVFYPLPYNHTWKLFSPRYVEDILSLRHQSVAMHLWSNVIRNGPNGLLQKWPPAGSFLDYLYKSAGLTKPVGHRVSSLEVARFRIRQEGRTLMTGLEREYLRPRGHFL